MLRRAIELDPNLAEAYGFLSYAIVVSMTYFDSEPSEGTLQEALAVGRKGVELDEQDAMLRFTYGRALLAAKAYGDAISELEIAIDLNPYLAPSYCGLGNSLAYEGRFDEAIPYFQKAIELSPYDPLRWAFYSYRALAHIFARQFDQAFEWSHKATRVPNAHYWAFAHRVSALGHLQRHDDLQGREGRAAAAQSGFLLWLRTPASLLRQGQCAAGPLRAGSAPCRHKRLTDRPGSGNGHQAHSITSSAATIRPAGGVNPKAFAVLTLRAVSYLTGTCTGRSAGLAPRRILSTYNAACR